MVCDVATAKAIARSSFSLSHRLTRQVEFAFCFQETFIALAALTFSLVFLAESSIGTPISRAQEVSATGQVAEADKAYQAKTEPRGDTLWTANDCAS